MDASTEEEKADGAEEALPRESRGGLVTPLSNALRRLKARRPCSPAAARSAEILQRNAIFMEEVNAAADAHALEKNAWIKSKLTPHAEVDEVVEGGGGGCGDGARWGGGLVGRCRLTLSNSR
jgi:hypothetical protein